MRQRQTVTKKKALVYRPADQAGKSRILIELVELAGWHRDFARAAWRDALTLKVVKPRAARTPTYGPAVTKALVKCWAVLRAPAGKRLAPMLPVLVPLLRCGNELLLTDDEAALLVRMSAATIDRRLAPARAKLLSRGRSHTKPGTLLKSQIPIRTWADWDDAVPRFVEIDLVGHKGRNASCEHCFIPTVTDIATGCTVNRSVPNKAEKWVFDALMHVGRARPVERDLGTRPDVHELPPVPAEARVQATQRRESDMNAEFKRVHPAAQSRQILALTGRLEALAWQRNPPPSNLPSTGPGTRDLAGGSQMRQRINAPGGIDVRQQGIRCKKLA